jgi:hypothetical protein
MKIRVTKITANNGAPRECLDSRAVTVKAYCNNDGEVIMFELGEKIQHKIMRRLK